MTLKNHFLTFAAVSFAIVAVGLHTDSLFADTSIAMNDKTSDATQPYYYYNQNTKEFFLYGEWIYWKPITENPMNWEENNESLATGPGSNKQFNKIRCIKYDYSSGFRVGGGYRFARNTLENNIRPWQIEAEYTRLHTAESGHATASGSVSDRESEFVIALVPQTNGNRGLIKGHSRAILEYDRIDLKFAWPIWMRSNVIMRLMTGATCAWFENNWSNYFSANAQNSNQIFNPKLEWEWWGGGVYGGGDIYMAIGKGLGFFADTSFALLCGPMKQKEEYFSGNDFSAFSEVIKFRPYMFQPVASFRAGIDFKHWFDKTVMLHLALGWECTCWFELNQFGRVNTNRNIADTAVNSTTSSFFFNEKPTDLIYEGLTTRIGFDF